MYKFPRYLLLFVESGRFVTADDLDNPLITEPYYDEAQSWTTRDDAIKTYDMLCQQYFDIGMKPPKVQLMYADLSKKRKPEDLVRGDIIDTELLMPAGVR